MTAPEMPATTKPDHRRARSARTRAALVEACRALMREGDFRPKMPAICKQAECSVRSGFQHFPTIDALYVEALKDSDTREIAFELIVGERWPGKILWDEPRRAILHAVVFGRPIERQQEREAA